MPSKDVMALFTSAIETQMQGEGTPETEPPAPDVPPLSDPAEQAPLDVAGSAEEIDEPAPEPETVDGGADDPIDAEQYQDPDSITGLAEVIGRDPSYLYGLKMRLGENGEELTIGESKDKIQELARENRELKTQMESAATAPPVEQQTEHHQLLAGAQAEKQRLQAEWQKVDWKAIESADPVQALLSRQKFQEAWAYATQAEQVAQQGIETVKAEAQAKLAAGVPGWSDATVMAAERQQLSNWLASEFQVPADRVMAETHPGLMRAMKELYAMKKNPVVHPKPSGNIKPLNPGRPQPAALSQANQMKKLQQTARQQKGRAQLNTIGSMIELKLQQQRKKR